MRKQSPLFLTNRSLLKNRKIVRGQGVIKGNRPATKNRRVNIEQGIMNIEGENFVIRHSLFDIRYSFFSAVSLAGRPHFLVFGRLW